MDEMINTRIRKIMEDSKMNSTQFAATVGITRSNLAHILSGRNQPSFSLLEKILRAFPEVRSEWLVTGLGAMTKDADEMEVMKKAMPAPQTEKSMQAALLFDELPLETHELDRTDEPKEEIQSIGNESVTPVSEEVVSSPAPRAGRRKSLKSVPYQSGKTVRKIVYFYTDHTFEEFYPEQ